MPMRRHALSSVYKATRFLSHLQKGNAINLSVSVDIVEASIFRTHTLLLVALLQLRIEHQHECDTVSEIKSFASLFVIKPHGPQSCFPVLTGT